MRVKEMINAHPRKLKELDAGTVSELIGTGVRSGVYDLCGCLSGRGEGG